MVAITERHLGSPEPNSPKEKLSTRKKLLMAVGAGAVSVAAIFGVAHSGSDEKSVPQESSVTHDSSVKGAENTFKDHAIAKGETLNLLKAHSDNFDSWRGIELGLMKQLNQLSADEIEFLDQNYASLSQKSDKSTYTNNEILAAVALDIGDASAQDDVRDGVNMLPLVVSPNADGYNHILSVVSDPSAGAVVTIYSENGSSLDRLSSGSFLDEKIENTKDARAIVQTKFAGVGSKNDTYTELGVYVLNSDGNGHEQWQLLNRYSMNSQRVQDAITSLNLHN